MAYDFTRSISVRFLLLGSSMRSGSTRYCFLLLLVLVCRMQAQTTTSGALAGVVIDQTDAVVTDAAVQINDLSKGSAQSTKTDREGIYQFSFLRPGRYTLTVMHAGFQEERRSLTIQVGPPATVNIT